VRPPAIGYNAGMSTVTVHDLQKNAGALLDRVQAGERLVVVRDNRPVAELRPIEVTRPGPRPFGLCAGAFTVPADFDAPLPEHLLREFEGR
jgi:prevent-host-death family protein